MGEQLLWAQRVLFLQPQSEQTWPQGLEIGNPSHAAPPSLAKHTETLQTTGKKLSFFKHKGEKPVLYLSMLPFTAEAINDLSASGRGSSPSMPHHQSPNLPHFSKIVYDVVWAGNPRSCFPYRQPRCSFRNRRPIVSQKGFLVRGWGFWGGSDVSQGALQNKCYCLRRYVGLFD